MFLRYRLVMSRTRFRLSTHTNDTNVRSGNGTEEDSECLSAQPFFFYPKSNTSFGTEFTIYINKHIEIYYRRWCDLHTRYSLPTSVRRARCREGKTDDALMSGFSEK
jgi:hypothetical protein